MKWFNKFTALNLGLLFVLTVSVAGCGTALGNLSPIQPVHNIATALEEQTENPNEEVVVPAVPSETLAKPLLDKHGMSTVGFRIGKARDANMEALTYIFAFDEYAHAEDQWSEFLNDWTDTQMEIERGSGEDRKVVDVIMMSDYPQLFEVQSRQPILTKTEDDITVSIAYWRRPDLDRKYNRGNAFSPFYETEALHQGDKTDVFYVKITNNRSENIIFNVKKCQIVDQDENLYGGMDYDDLEERFTYMARATGLYVKNGLETARRILIEKRMPIVEKQVGTRRTGIPPGKSVEGFLPFIQTKLNALELRIVLPIEKAPPPGAAQRYRTIEFDFPFTHDRGIRVAQPSPKRY
ncbi:hypothetical protein J4G07_14795 [Candidatus Poribacteria bacterium]|nr:hypothetical protein [Candidatus Poribacteria bacterium]